MFSGIRYRPMGYEQLTGLSSAKALASVPAGADGAIFVVSGQAVRFRDDGVAPTSALGIPIAVDEPYEYNASLATIEFIEQSASATVNVWYYKVAG